MTLTAQHLNAFFDEIENIKLARKNDEDDSDGLKPHERARQAIGGGAAVGGIYGGLGGAVKDAVKGGTKRLVEESIEETRKDRAFERASANAKKSKTHPDAPKSKQDHKEVKGLEDKFNGKSKYPLALRDPKTPEHKPSLLEKAKHHAVSEPKRKVKAFAAKHVDDVKGHVKDLTSKLPSKGKPMSTAGKWALRGAAGGASLGYLTHGSPFKPKDKHAMPLSMLANAGKAPIGKTVGMAGSAMKGALRPAATAAGKVQGELAGAKSLLPGGAGPMQLWK